MSGLVSVLMCVYNTPLNYLNEAVRSILDQTYNNFEFIIVDDASDDEDVLHYLRKIENEIDSIKVIHNANNKGLTKSLNIGLKECIGEYIARMDSDDISLPDRFFKQIEFMKNNPEVALAGSTITCFNDNADECKSVVTYNDLFDWKKYKVRSLIQHSGPPHPTFMFRATFLRDNNIWYPEKILKAQDYGIMAEILKAGGKIYIIPETLLKYRIHAGQITTRHESEQKIYQLKVSYDYVRALFPDLSNCESLAISALGCPIEVEDILEELKRNEKLSNNCEFNLNDIKSLNDPKNYISGQKKVFKYNKSKKYFDQHILKYELGFRWWAMSIRKGLKKPEHWGLSIYTLKCAFYSLKKKYQYSRG